jgi:DNA-binding ferritin-like protein
MKKNGHGLDMFKVKATQHDFAELIASCYKKHDLLQKIVETETKVVRDYQKAISASSAKGDEDEDGDDQLVTTLRMTIVGFD